MLLKRLREDTADLHAAVERRVEVTDGRLTAGRYVATLAAFHGFHAPWEAGVRAAAGPAGLGLPAVLDLMSSRWRTASLAADLAHFGVDPADVPSCPDVPSVDGLAHLLGSMYVMEGSTLGGQVVARHVERTLGLSGGVGYSYFRGHGDQVGPRWRAFAARLVELAAGAREDDVVAGARHTFAALDRWFGRALAAPAARYATVAAPAATVAVDEAKW
jgi:heme oxygenase